MTWHQLYVDCVGGMDGVDRVWTGLKKVSARTLLPQATCSLTNPIPTCKDTT